MSIPDHTPFQPGNSAEFWLAACGVQLEGTSEGDWGLSNAQFFDNKSVGYQITHLHGSRTYVVSREEVMRDFESVLELLQKKVDAGTENVLTQGYQQWQKSLDGRDRAMSLVQYIDVARERRWGIEDPGVVGILHFEKQEIFERWRRSNWYWAAICFEWTFLSGLVWFALWPGIRALSPARWGFHIGLIPILFMTPFYLGYAGQTFTSAHGSAGILYPRLLIFFRGGSVNKLDVWILTHLPQILEPLSLSSGSPIALTGYGFCGPTFVCGLSVVLGFSVPGIALFLRRRRSRLQEE